MMKSRAAGLAGEFREAQHPRFVDAPSAHRKHSDRVFLRSPLEDNGVEIVEPPRGLELVREPLAAAEDLVQDAIEAANGWDHDPPAKE